MGGRRHSETNYRNMHKLCCCTLHVHALYCASFCMHLYVICIYMYSTANLCGFQILRDPWQAQSVWACCTGGVSCPKGKLVLGTLSVKCFSTLLCSFTACRDIWIALRQVQVECIAMGMQQLNSPLAIGECRPYHCMLGTCRQAGQTFLSCDRKLCPYDCKVPYWNEKSFQRCWNSKSTTIIVPSVLAFSGHNLLDATELYSQLTPHIE